MARKMDAKTKVLLLEKESIYKNKREVVTWQRYKVRCQEINQAKNKKSVELPLQKECLGGVSNNGKDPVFRKQYSLRV